MRLLICGNRYWSDKEAIKNVLVTLSPTVLIEGEAPGADTLSRICAEEMNIPVLKFSADWKKFGRAAGPIRNKQMLDKGKPNLVVAFHDNIAESKGTKNMLAQAKKAGVCTMLYNKGFLEEKT